LPIPSPAGADSTRAGQGGKAAGAGAAVFDGHAKLTARPADPQLFVAPGRSADVSDVSVDVTPDNAVRFAFKVAVLKGQRPPEKVTAVLAYTDEAGHRRGIEYTFADVSALTSH
jgi:hypothetical protein